MAKQTLLQGAKGGSGSTSVTTTPDTLRSADTMEVILGLCEGPIVGLSNGAKSFYVGDTQLQNENGENNFPTVTLNFFPGDEDADPVIPTLGGLTNNNSVNLALSYNVPVTRQTTIIDIDFIDVRLAISRLMRTDNNGTYKHSLKLRLEYKPLTAASWTKVYGQDITLNDKTTSTYVKEIRIAVPRLTEPYEIRVTKLSPDSTSTEYTDVAWESYQETIATQRAFNNTAVIQLVGQGSDQFSSIPQWSGVYKGLIIRIPSNYNPVTRTSSGVWDGTFQMAWCNNPAWVLYDFVMNDRYGLKYYYPEVNLDKYDVEEAAQWCDVLVPDGRGGTHPRFTFDAALTEARSGKELARYIAGAFNATFFDDLNGTAYLRVDKDDDAVHLFTRENIMGGDFEYSYTDITSRYNDITVTFVNPDLNWEQDRRRVKDDTYIAKNGSIPLDFIAVGCTNEQQALRMAQYRLITANTETCMVQFTTNRLGQFVSPFDIILISDPDMGYGISGRVKSFSPDGATVYLRDPVYLEAGVPYSIRITLKDGTYHVTTIQVATRGYVTEFGVTDPVGLDTVPDRPVFTLEHSTLLGTPRPFRVLKVEEKDGHPDQYAIEAININRNKWYDSDNVTNSGEISYAVLPSPLNPPPPTSVGIEERYIPNLKQFQAIISPVFDRGAYKYYMQDHSFEVWTRPAGTTEGFVQRQLLYGDTLVDHPPGDYEVKVVGISYLGGKTPLADATSHLFTFTNPKDPPVDIDWVKINQKEIYWGYSNPPEDFAGFVVRYQNQANRLTWDDAIQPHLGLITTTSLYTNLIPSSARVIMVRAVDDFGVMSGISYILRPLGDLYADNLIDQTDFHPTWSGTKVGCSVSSGTLIADDTGTFYSGVDSAYLYDGGNFYETVYEELSYHDQFVVPQAGGVFATINFSGSGYEVKIRPIETPEATWQPLVDKQQLDAGDYEVWLRVFGGPTRGVVNTFSLTLDAAGVTEDVQDVTVPSGGTVRVPLTKTYSVIRIVNVIIQDTGSSTAMGYRVVDKDPVLGPQITLLNAAGSPTGGLVDVQIKGY